MDIEQAQEITRLKDKCNKLIHLVNEQQKKLELSEADLIKYKNSDKGNSNSSDLEIPITGDVLVNNLVLFNQCVSEMIKADAFLVNKKSTVLNRKYFSVTYSKCQEYLENMRDEMDSKDVMRIWALMGLIATDDTDKYIFSYTFAGDNLRVIRIRKKLINVIKENMQID